MQCTLFSLAPFIIPFLCPFIIIFTVGLYADSAKGPIFVLQDTDNAVTHLQFSLDGQYLFSGSRKVWYFSGSCWMEGDGVYVSIFPKRDMMRNSHLNRAT